MSVENYIEFYKFEPQRLTLGGVQSKTPKTPQNPNQGNQNQNQNKTATSYQQADFFYLYKLPNGTEIRDSFHLELCTVKCNGIEVPHDNYNNYQIKAVFDKNTQETQDFLKMADVIHGRMVDLICEPSVNLALKAQNVDPGLAKQKGRIFKKLVHFPADKVTGETDFNKNPTQYFKLRTYDGDGSKTKFLAVDENKKINEIPWSTMQNAQFSGKPLIKYSHVYSNSIVVSPISHVASMILEDAKPRGSDNAQKNSLLAMVEKRPEIVTNVTAGLASIQEKLAQMSMSGPNGFKSNTETKKPEPLTNNPVEIKPPVNSLNSFMREGQTQVYAGSIQPQGNPQVTQQGNPQGVSQNTGIPQNSGFPQNTGYPQNVGVPQNSGFPQNQMAQGSHSPQVPQAQESTQFQGTNFSMPSGFNPAMFSNMNIKPNA